MKAIANNWKRHLISMILTALGVVGGYLCTTLLGLTEFTWASLKYALIVTIVVTTREIIKIVTEIIRHYYNLPKAISTEPIA